MSAKKLFAVILSVTVLLSCLIIPGMTASAADELDVWNGETAVPVDSDSDGVYEINTPEELAYIASGNGGGRSYILTTDIYLNDLAAVDWATGTPNEGFEPKEWYENIRFKGTFDGNGHTVFGIWYPVGNNLGVTDIKNVGLFPGLSDNTTVKNIKVSKSYLESRGFAGAIVGFTSDILNANILIDNCYSDNTVTVIAHQINNSGNYQFGSSGIMGGFYNCGSITISNCCTDANNLAYNLSGTSSTRNSKIVGDIWLAGSDWATQYTNLVMKNCYANGGKPCPGNNQATFTTFENVYSTVAKTTVGNWTQVSAANMTGTAAATNMAGLGSAFYITAGTPALKVFSGISANAWGGFRDSDLEGEGTTEKPYLVYTPEELAYAVNTTENKVFQLQNDIVLNDIVVKIEDGVGVIYKADGETLADKSTLIPWSSGAFPGTIDGNGYVVRGMYFEGKPATDNTSASAWEHNFAFIKRATKTTVVENLGIEDSYVVAIDGTAAGFVGYLQTASPIVRNSYLGSSVYLEGQCVGGIYGSGDMGNFGENCIENCIIAATINCHGTRWGAFYAETWSRGNNTKNMSIRNCYATMRLADGLGGWLSVQTCYGDVTATEGNIGSIHDGNTMYLGDAFMYVEGGLPVLKVFNKEVDMAWGGLGGIFFEGDGSQGNPYKISTAAQLAYMVRLGGNGKYYELTNDIVITDLDAVNWATGEVKENLGYTPVPWFSGTNAGGMSYKNINSDAGSFSGYLNGNGYKVSGLYYEPYYSGRDIETEGKWNTSAGLIPAISSGSVSNLMLTDSYVFAGRFTGAVSGYTKNATLNNIVVTDTVMVVNKNVGAENEGKAFESYSASGITGYAQGTLNMDNCGSNATLDTVGHINGLVGTQWGTTVNISNSYCVGYKPIAAAGGGGTNTLTNVYGDVTASADPAVTKLETSQITGKNALDNMPGLDSSFWYGVTGQGPLFRSYGERITDISRDGKFELASEIEALRVGLITNEQLLFADLNTDTFVDICDLVKISK